MNLSGIMRWRVAGLLLAMLIIVGMPYVVTRENTQATQSANAWVTHSTAVRSLSQGRATYSMEFKHYTEAPKNVAEAIINKK